VIFWQSISHPLNCKHVFYPGLHCYQPIKRFIRTCFLITSQSSPSSFTCSCASRPIAVDLHSQFSSCSTRAFISPPTLHFHLAFPGVTILRRSSGAYVLSACFVTSYRHVFSIQKKLSCNIFKVVVNKWFWG